MSERKLRNDETLGVHLAPASPGSTSGAASGGEGHVELAAASEHAVAAGAPAQSLQAHPSAAEPYAQRMQLLGALAGGVAHDFNNLLTIIGAATSALVAGAERTARAEHLAAILDAVDRATALTRELLVFAHGGDAPRTELDLNEVVSDARRLLARVVGDAISLRVDLERGLPPVAANRTQLDQILMNLVTNARDAMPGGGEISIRTASRGEGRRAVVLSVSDTGTGIPDAVRARMFEPLFTTKGTRGTGLGLAVVRDIGKSLDATIEVETRLGHGTRFDIVLATSGRSPAHPPDEPSAQRAPRHVLLLEPDPMLRDALREAIVRGGLECTALGTTDDANRVATLAAGIDVVVCDESCMPLALDPPRPTLTLSASTLGDTEQGAAGAVLAKPFTPESLLLAIESLLARA